MEQRETAEEKAEKAAWAAHCKAIASLESGGERFRRRARGVAFLIGGLLIGFLVWSGATWANHAQGTPAHSETWGTAWTQSCERLGPVSRLGLGYWWECEAAVDWLGHKEQRQFLNFVGELSPADIGKPVRVTSLGPGTNQGSPTYLRDTTHPWQGTYIFLSVVAALILFFGVGSAGLYLFPLAWRLEVDKKLAARLREQYRREGRGPLL